MIPMSESSVSVVIPAFQEEKLIQRTLAGIPDFVDHIIVVDDSSPDGTSAAVRAHHDPRVALVVHEFNQGVGAAIVSGYERARALGSDVYVVMAGDNQMDPTDLPALLEPIERGEADYVKGNRLVHRQAADMPRLRRQGTKFLASVTSRAARYPLGDTQCGYTAITRDAYECIRGENIWPRYGYPNDMLIALSHRAQTIAEVPVRPVYADESSGLRPWHLLSILRVIARRMVLDGLQNSPSGLHEFKGERL